MFNIKYDLTQKKIKYEIHGILQETKQTVPVLKMRYISQLPIYINMLSWGVILLVSCIWDGWLLRVNI